MLLLLQLRLDVQFQFHVVGDRRLAQVFSPEEPIPSRITFLAKPLRVPEKPAAAGTTSGSHRQLGSEPPVLVSFSAGL